MDRELHALSNLRRAQLAEALVTSSNWRRLGLMFEQTHLFTITYAKLRAKLAPSSSDLALCENLLEELASRLITVGDLARALENPRIGMNSLARELREEFRNPNEIESRGPETLQAFSEALKHGKMKPFRSKLMVVGQARAGKTSLLRAMTGQMFNNYEASTHVMEVCDIDVRQWRVVSQASSDFYAAMTMHVMRSLQNRQSKSQSIKQELDEVAVGRLKELEKQRKVLAPEMEELLEEWRKNQSSIVDELSERNSATESPSKLPFAFNTWDFAGQDVYYSIHPIFITDRAHYVVVFSLKEAADNLQLGKKDFLTNLDFWIKSISHYTNNSRLLLVGTHADQVQDQSVWQKISQCILDDIFKDGEERIPAYDSLIPNRALLFFPVDNEKKVLPALVLTLAKALKSDLTKQRANGFLANELPLRWLHLQEEVRLLARTAAVASYSDIEKLAVDTCNIEKNQVKHVLQFLHDIGQIVFYADITDKNGERRVIIDPRWLIGRTKELIPMPEDLNLRITPSQRDALLAGKTTLNILQGIWCDHNAEFLINLMKKFGLLCTSDNINFTIPFSKPTELPKWNHLDKTHLTCFFKFDEFLPEALFHYLAVHFVNNNSNTNFRAEVNRNACILQIANHTTFLQLIPSQHQIKVVVERRQRQTPYKVIEAIEARIASLTDLWVKKLGFCVLVRCPRCPENSNGMAMLKKPDFCTARPQCSLSGAERLNFSLDWKTQHQFIVWGFFIHLLFQLLDPSKKNGTSRQQYSVKKKNRPRSPMELEIYENLSWELNNKLASVYKELARRVGYRNVRILETNPGNEVAELVIRLYESDKSKLRRFYKLLQEFGEVASVELINDSIARPLFVSNEH